MMVRNIKPTMMPMMRIGLLRPSSLAQQLAGCGLEFAQVELLRLAVMLIKITARPGKSSRDAHRFKSTSPVAGASITRLIDIGLAHPDRMTPSLLPVWAELPQAQTERTRSQIRVALPLRQNEEATIVDDQRQAAGALPWSPANPTLARLEME